jgi:flagellar protein FliT
METGHPVKPPEAIQSGWNSLVSAVNHFYQLTIELIQLLENSNLERDDKINKMEAMLNHREGLMINIAPPYTAEEVEVGKKINHLNIKLSQLLQAEKALVQKDIKVLQTKKETNTKYVNPYQNLSTDGMFYDKRK